MTRSPPRTWVSADAVTGVLDEVPGARLKVSHVAPCPSPAQPGVEGRTDLGQAGCVAGMVFSEHSQPSLLCLGTWGGFAALVQNAAAPVLLRALQEHHPATILFPKQPEGPINPPLCLGM